jgi:hypothetical protein
MISGEGEYSPAFSASNGCKWLNIKEYLFYDK